MTTYIVTGPPGAGKSSLSDALAKKLPLSICVCCDGIYNMVKGGYRAPWDDDGRLHGLMVGTAIDIIHRYSDAGFDVVVDYVFSLDELKAFLPKISGSVVLTVLLPDVGVNISRDKDRKWAVGEDRVRKYHDEFASEQSFKPFLVSSSNFSPDELGIKILSIEAKAVEEILQMLGGVR